MQVQYFDEYVWRDVASGMMFEFANKEGSKVAEVTIRNGESRLWKFEVFVPEKYQLEGGLNPAGIVYSSAAAKRVAETILLNTILVRS